jgi:NADPH-dependent 7-cyano-7-deazaguanine reductase QueF-like protein
MLAEVRKSKQYIGLRWGYGEHIPDGRYAIPCDTSRGTAFMALNMKDDNFQGADNFHLYWDEQLTLSWYDIKGKPEGLVESEFSIKFREIVELT